MQKTSAFALLLAVCALILPSLSEASAGVTYHGRLLKPDGTAVVEPSVEFKVQIRTPGAENCLLYQETHIKNLSQSNGIFAIGINDGTAAVVNVEPFSLDRIFQNRGTFTFAGGKCSIGNTYAANTGDGRRIVVEFNDGTFVGYEPLPSQAINFVPMSMESITVGGYNAPSLLRVVDGSGNPASVSALSTSQHTTLMDLIAGTSASYLTPSSSLAGGNLVALSVTDAQIASGISGSKITGNISGHAAGFSGSLSGDVSGTQGATLVEKIQGRAISNSAPADGQVLKWVAAMSRWEPAADVSGGAGLVLAADAEVSGTKALAANDSRLTNARTPTAHSHPVNHITSGTGIYLTYKPNDVACADGEVLKWSTAGQHWLCGVDGGGGGGSGTVTSIGVAVPAYMTTTADITTAGDVTIGFASQTARTVFAAPTGGAGVPTFRGLNIGDIFSTGGGAFLTASGACPTGEQLTYMSGTDTISCQAYSLTSAQVTGALTYSPVNPTALANYLALAGGTMSGNIAMGGNKITGVSNVPYVAVNPGAGDDGKTLRWNNTSGQWEWFTAGAAGAGIGTLNGLTATSQNFAVALSGTVPAFTSGTATHTLNLPLAATVGATGGVITKAEYDSFAAKQSAGNYITALTGDVTAAGPGSAGATIANDAVTTAKIANSAVTDAKIATVSVDKIVSAATKYFTYAPNNVACVNGQVLKKTANGWECGTDQGGLGSVTSVTSVNADIGVATTTTTPVLTLNSGTGANQIAKMDASGNFNMTVAGSAIRGDFSNSTWGDRTWIQSSTVNGATDLGLKPNGTATTSQITTVNNSDANGAISATKMGIDANAGYVDSFVKAGGTQLPLDLRINGSGRLRVATNGNVGIGTTTIDTKLHVAGTIKIADGAETCSVAANGGMIRYSGTALQYCNGTSWQTLGVSGAGLTSLGGLTGGTQTFAAGAAGLTPAINSSGTVHTLDIPLAATASVTSGTISNAQFTTFNSKVGPTRTLTAGTGLTGGGDLSADRTFAVNVGTGAGQIPQLDGGGKLLSAVLPNLSVADLKGVGGVAQFVSASCLATQTLTWSSLTDAFTCSTITGVPAANITNTAAGTIAATTVQTALNEIDSEKVAKAGDTMTGILTLPTTRFVHQSSDPAGVAGHGSLYAKNDGKLYFRDGTGTVTDLMAGGGGSTPGGSDTQIQYNKAGVMEGVPVAFYNEMFRAFLVGDTKTDTSGASMTFNVTTTLAPPSASTAQHDVSKVAVNTGNNQNLGTIRANNTVVNHTGSGNLSNVYSVTGSFLHSGTGTAATGVGLVGLVANQSSGTITNAYGVYVSNSGSGPVTNGYGVYINNVPGTTNYGLYQAIGTTKNYFAGDVGVGTTTPNAKLTVGGAMSLAQQSSDPAGAASFGTLFAKNDGKLYFRNGTGTVTDLMAGGGAAGGSSGEIQFNNGGTLSSSSNLKWDDTTGSLGIGTAPTARLHVDQTTVSTTGSPTTTNINQTVSPVGASSASSSALNTGVTVTSGAISGMVNGAIVGTNNTGATSISQLLGFASMLSSSSGTVGTGTAGLFSLSTGSTGTMSTAIGVKGMLSASGTSTMTTGTAGHFEVGKGGSATITNGYGVYIAQVQATNKYSLYSSDATAPSYFAGNVGIGTATAVDKLQVYTTGNSHGMVHTDGTRSVGTYLYGTSSYDGGWMGTKSNHDLYLSTNSSAKVVVTKAGNVGIGNVSDANAPERLSVFLNGTSTTPVTVRTPDWVNNTTGTALNTTFSALTGSTTAGLNVVNAGGSTAGDFFLQSNGGKVGIGTAAPRSILEAFSPGYTSIRATTVSSNDAATAASISLWRSRGTPGAQTYPLSGDRLGYFTAANGVTATSWTGMHIHATENQSAAAQGAEIHFLTTASGGTGGTIRMTVDDTGYVGIGTTAPSHILQIMGQGRSTNSSWATTSDIRLKDVTGKFQYGLDEILKLNTIWFHYKKDNPVGLPSDKTHSGIVAQELQKVIPEAVEQTADGYLTVNSDPVHWTVVNAIQELYRRWTQSTEDQNAQIAAVNARADRLEAENAELKARLERIEESLRQPTRAPASSGR